MYDTTCITQNRFSNFHCVYTIIQVVDTEFIKVVLTEYSAFKISSKMIQEQVAAAVVTALISKKKKSMKKREKKTKILSETWLKRRKNLKFYATLFAELRSQDEYNYNILLRITSDNFEKIFQLIKDITKENTKLRELIPPRL